MRASVRTRQARRLALVQGAACAALIVLSLALIVGAFHWEFVL